MAKLSDEGASEAADAVLALLDSGYLRIYDGDQPATADTPLDGQNLLAELRFDATSFGDAVAGVATANPITADDDAAATGTASWFRCLKLDGTTVVVDGSIATSGDSDLVLNSTAIMQHALVEIPAFPYIQARS